MNEDSLDPSGVARLYSVARALTGALTATDVAAAVFDRALAALGADSAGLWLVSAGTIRFVGAAGMEDRIPTGISVMPIESDLPAAIVVRTGEPITFGTHAERNQRWPELARLGSFSEATAVLPLVASGRPLGCLHIGYSQPMEVEQFDISFLMRLAELCAAALDRAQLHDAEAERQAFLLDASSAVTSAGSFEETLHRLASVAVPRMADLCLIDVWESPGRIRRMAAVHADPSVAPLVEELKANYPPEPGGRHPASEAMDGGRSMWMSDMTDEYLHGTTRDARHLELARQLKFRSFMCVPLSVAGEVLGAITLVSSGSGRRFGAADLSLAEDLATRVADVVSAARRHDREHELAHVLQRLLLPDQLPVMEGLDFSARYLTARSDAEAGGDFYDVVELPSGRVGIVIGDVEGHDPVAAAIMGQLRSAIRALAGQHREPGALMDALRWSWDLLGFSRMATCLVGRLDVDRDEVVLCSAGHLPPVLIEPDGNAHLLDTETGPPLGAPGGPAAERRYRVEPGATLFLYTDGLIETSSTGIDDELEQLRLSLVDASGVSLEDLCDRIISVHAGSGDRPDDVAVLAIRRRRPDGAPAPPEATDELELPLDTSSVGAGRRWVDSRLEDWSEDGRSKAVLVASELVANVVLHARTAARLRLTRDGSACRLSVADGDGRRPQVKRYSDDAPTGRGLRLISQLSERWGVETVPGGKQVWVELRDRPWPVEGADAEAAGPVGGDNGPGPAAGPGPGGSRAPISVHLSGVPVAVLLEAQEHNDELMREFAFLAGSRHLSASLSALAREVSEHFGPAGGGITTEIESAAAGGRPTVDLRVEMSREGWTALRDLSALLDQADEFCDRSELLTLASSPPVRRLRQWYTGQVTAQMAGGPATPWADEGPTADPGRYEG